MSKSVNKELGALNIKLALERLSDAVSDLLEGDVLIVGDGEGAYPVESYQELVAAILHANKVLQ